MKIKNMKKLIAGCLILSLLGSTASVCFGMNSIEVLKETTGLNSLEEQPTVQESLQEESNDYIDTMYIMGKKDTGLSTGAKVGIGVGVTAGVAAVVTAVVVPCVIFKDKIKAWFTGPFVDFFTKTIPNAFSKKPAKAK